MPKGVDNEARNAKGGREGRNTQGIGARTTNVQQRED